MSTDLLSNTFLLYSINIELTVLCLDLTREKIITFDVSHTHCRHLLWQSHYLCQLQKNYRNALGMWAECHAFRPITIIYTFIFLHKFHQKLNVRLIKNVNERIGCRIGFLASILFSLLFVIQSGKKKQLKKTQNSLLAPHFIFLCFCEFSEHFSRGHAHQYQIC